MKAKPNVAEGVLKPMTSGGIRGLAGHSVMLKQSLHLGVAAICHAGLAVLMAWYVIARIGVSVESDAFFASGALPQFVFALLSTTLVPVLVPLLALRDDNQFRVDAWSFLSLTTALFLVIALVMGVTSFLWVPWIVPGFSLAGKALTLHLTKIQLASMVLNAMIVILWALHHARQRFLWVELSGSLANVAGFAFLIVTLPRFGIVAAAWNTVFYNSLKLIFLLPILGGWRRPTWHWSVIREAWQRWKPLLPAHVYLRTDPLLNRFLASLTGAGSLSLLYVAQQIYASILLLVGKAVAAPMTPKLAIEARENNSGVYRRTYYSRLSLMLVVTCCGCLLLAAAAPAFKLLSGHGGITPDNVRALWLIMMALAGTLVGGALGQVTAGAYYAAGNTRTPTKISTILYSFFIPLKIASFFRYGMLGLAVTMSAYSLTNFLVQFLALRSRVRIGEETPIPVPSSVG
jgi:peptidoglycan biosynthesis protein MviN/MurJ (putative lipid II flippase)